MLVSAATPLLLPAQARGGRVALETVQFAAELDVDLSQSRRINRSLYVRDLIVGDGRLATRGDALTLRYTGAIADGRRFTEPDEPPATFKLGAGQVIQGWEHGLPGMRVGGRRQLIIGPDEGYGREQTGVIPPSSVLVFEVELLAVR